MINEIYAAGREAEAERWERVQREAAWYEENTKDYGTEPSVYVCWKCDRPTARPMLVCENGKGCKK